MSTPLVLSPAACRGKSWHPPVDLRHVAKHALIPLHMWELAQAAASMPLALVRDGTDWQLVAVCGQQAGHNLFVAQDRWLGQYQPEWLASYPFQIFTVRDKGLVTFASDCGLLAEGAAGEPFFDQQGQMTPAVLSRVETLKANFGKYQATARVISALAAAGVLTRWSAELVEATGIAVDGLYLIDEPALAMLDEAAFLELRRAKALPLAYAVNLSLPQSHLLARLARVNPVRAEAAVDLDTLFGDDDDSLSFNF